MLYKIKCHLPRRIRKWNFSYPDWSNPTKARASG